MRRVNRHLVLVAAAVVAASALLAWGLVSPSTTLGQSADVGLPTDVAEQEPTALPPQAPVETGPSGAELPSAQQPAAAALPSAGSGGFHESDGLLTPALVLAMASGGFLVVGALAGLATTRRKNKAS